MKNITQRDTGIQPKIKTEMNGKGLTVHAGLLPVLNFMGKLLFRGMRYAGSEVQTHGISLSMQCK